MNSSHSLDLTPGDFFAGRYQVEDLLGRGGMGAVYSVRDFCVAERIALKVLAFGPEPPPLVLLRFREEVRLSRRVTHPNVARVHDIGEQDGIFYLTMELVSGDTLRSVLNTKGAIAPGRAVKIARSLCEGLQAAHDAGVVHRDLKPSNVLIDPGERVVITDFGIAHSVLDCSDFTVGAIGTPNYMAPEQATGGKIDGRTDLYALGLVLCEMLLGERPDPLLPVTAEKLKRVASPALVEVALRCLDPVPDNRPASAREVTHLLSSVTPDDVDGESKARAYGSISSRDANRSAEQPVSLPVLAVLPFHYRGPDPRDYLSEAFTDELVDALARLRELTVVRNRTTANPEGDRDPRELGSQLHAYAVVDGTVQTAGDRVRIIVRLIDVASGTQLWSDRYETARSDAFSLQESTAQRIAEQLRIEVNARTRLNGAPSAAIGIYLDARRRLHAAGHMMSYPSAAFAMTNMERCLALAPDFAPALAAHAIASLRCWYLQLSEKPERDWPATVSASVTRALDEAPDLAESHLAAGMYATQVCDFRAASVSLSRALDIAPSCPDALEYLGMLECEAGRAEQGARRLRLASDLDPTLPYCLMFIARHLAFHDRIDQCQKVLTEMEQRCGADYFPLVALRTRFAAWQGDHGVLRRMSTADSRGDTSPSAFLRVYARGVLGDADQETLELQLSRGSETASSPRSRAFIAQLATEVYAGRGAVDLAEIYLLRAVDAALVDLEWMDHCPLLAPLRERPAFAEARMRVRARAEAIWAG